MLRIVKDTSASLRARSKPVDLPVSQEDLDTIYGMLQYLKDSQDPAFLEAHPKVRTGVGLAAPQIGVNKRMLVVYYVDGEEEICHMLINPQIIVNSVRKCYLNGGEGCLSVDAEHPGYVLRDYKITVKAIEARTKEEIIFKAVGYEAIVLQHEIDHLNGILFYDRIDKKDPFKVPAGSVEI